MINKSVIGIVSDIIEIFLDLTVTMRVGRWEKYNRMTGSVGCSLVGKSKARFLGWY